MDDAKAPKTATAPTDSVVEAWHQAWWFNLGLPTELQNRLREATDDLKARLAGRKE